VSFGGDAGAIYDAIGRTYAATRRPDPRIAARIAVALGDAASVLNVGAGAGSYEPRDRFVVAAEPSRRMIAQRPAGSAPAVRASAERLPFGDGSFAAALAVLTIHHWSDRARGLAELARVARDGVVLLTWDPEGPSFWLIEEYLPEIRAIDRAIFPSLAEMRRALGPLRVEPVPVPHDCIDGFLGAYWRRPEAYLDARIRAGVSAFAKLAAAEPALERLRADLENGTWHERHGDLATRRELDLGYRVVVTGALAQRRGIRQ